jgi:hypothetical protein
MPKDCNGKVVECSYHTTLSREIRPDWNWHELITEGWQKARTLRDMLSVLHHGFAVSLQYQNYEEPRYDEIDRLLFYFTQADGWADRYILELPNDDRGLGCFIGYDGNGNKIVKSQSEMRHSVAQKAMEGLCTNFFKKADKVVKSRDEGFSHIWTKLVLSERLFPVIQNFFRAEQVRFGSGLAIRNLPHRGILSEDKRSHIEGAIINFLLNLNSLLWLWEKPDTKWWGDQKEQADKTFAATQANIELAKPWMVEVLSNLGRLDALEEWILQLDRPCIYKLEEIALRQKLGYHHHVGQYIGDDRFAETLDEACFAGSEAAWFLKRYMLFKKEDKRLRAIRETESQMIEAQQRLQQLAGKRK